MRPAHIVSTVVCSFALACAGPQPVDPQGLGGVIDESIDPDAVVDAVVPAVYACAGVKVAPRTHGGKTAFVVDSPAGRFEVRARSQCSGQGQRPGEVVLNLSVGARDPTTGEALGELRRRFKAKGDCAAAERLAILDPVLMAPSEKLCTVGFQPLPHPTLDLAALLSDLAITGTVETVLATPHETRLLWTFNGTEYTIVGNAKCEQYGVYYDDADSPAGVTIAFSASDPEHKVGSWTKSVHFEHQSCSELPNARLREDIKREVQDLRATARIYERR